jgi:hypothetical protein
MNFEFASGSMIGRYHLGDYKVLKGGNNQDALALMQRPEFIAGVVCDGCGSGIYSEVGARVGAKYVLNNIESLMRESYYDDEPQQEKIDYLQYCITEDLTELAISLIDSESLMHENEAEVTVSKIQILNDYLFFTIMGFYMTEQETVFFHLGDGFYVVNGEVNGLEYPNNAPPYIAYNLIDEKWFSEDMNKDNLKMKYHVYPTETLENFLIATDGLQYFIDAEEKNMPGQKLPVGPVSQFWTQDAYYTNGDLVRRKLSVCNRDHIYYDKDKECLKSENGLLSDDLTVIVGRRKNETEME